jgi:hypothetical protein
VKGIAPQCRGLLIPVFKDGEGGAVVPCSQVDLARAITQAIQTAESEDASALVINVSAGQFSPSGQAHPILADVIRNCDKNRVMIVAAAGNQGCECLHLPGAIPSVLAVGAMKLDGDPLDFSNWGQVYSEQGVLAPGENILGALQSGGTTAGSGTSFATAIVSGVAALLLSLQLKRGSETSAETVGQGILQSALGCEHQRINDCRRLLAGRLHIPGAISAIIQGANSMSRVAEGTVTGGVPSQPPPVLEPKLDPQVAVAPSPQPSVDYLAPPTPSANMMPSTCACGGKSGPAQLVYALGKLSFDYGTRARRAYFTNAFFQSLGFGVSIDSASDLIRYLAQPGADTPQKILSAPRFENRTDITSIIWTLSIDDTPVYAVVPSDAFAFEVYDRLLEMLQDQVDEQRVLSDIERKLQHDEESGTAPKDEDTSPINLEVGRISVAGVISGQVRLYTGETVPIIRPDSRGVRNWTTKALLTQAQLQAFGTSPPSPEIIQTMRDLAEFLNTAYSQTRNLGVLPQDRAANFAATDAFVDLLMNDDYISRPATIRFPVAS